MRRGLCGHLAKDVRRRHPGDVDEEVGIYRDEVFDILGALADISSDTVQILAIVGGDNEEEEEYEEEEDDS